MSKKNINHKIPLYWEEACNEISARDKIMSILIKKNKNLIIKSHGDPFTTLIRAIIGQQISVRAASSIWNNLYTLTEKKDKEISKIQSDNLIIRPKSILKYKEKLTESGISSKKKLYILNLANYFECNTNFGSSLSKMDDEELNSALLSFPGIGQWTVNMFSIFHLLRPDVFPHKDLALIKSIVSQYSLKEKKQQSNNIKKISDNWKPWRTVATWYLWCSVDSDPIYY